MKHTITSRIIAALIATLLTAVSSHAAETTFTSRAAWDTAVGGSPDFTEDFNSTATGQFDSPFGAPVPIDVGPFTIGKTADSTDDSTSSNEITDGGFPNKTVNGTRYAKIFIDSADTGLGDTGDVKVEIILDTAVSAFGADFRDVNQNESNGNDDVNVMLLDATDTLIASLDVDTSAAIGFWGFTTDSPAKVKKIIFFAPVSGSGGNNTFGMDDVSAAENLAAGDTPPVAAPTSVPNVGLADMGLASYSLTITYSDDNAIDVSTLGAADITISGPGGSLTVNSATPDVGTDGSPRVVTYECTPPGGSWDFADNGTYTVAIVASQVEDDAGQPVPADASFATFSVTSGSGFATAFNNMTAFESSIGGASELDFMIDFEDFTADADFSNTTVDLPFTAPRVATLGHSGPNTTANFIDALPFAPFPSVLDVNGTNYAHFLIDVDDPNTAELIFDTPVAAWGAMLRGAHDDEDLEIDLYDMSGTLLDSLEHNIEGFFGFTSPSPGTVKRIVFRAVGPGGTSNNRFGMDDMKGAYTYTVNLDPLVSDVIANDVSIPDTGQTSYSFTIEYSDNAAIDVSTIDASDISVTGPGAIGTLAVVSGTEPSGTDGTPKLATYTVTPPGGAWDLADNGTYTIAILGTQVADDEGNFVAEDLTLDTFVVEARSNAVTDYTSKTAWTTAIGGTADWNEDFEAFTTPNADFSTTPVLSPTPAGGNFSMVRVGGSSTFGNFVDADPAGNVGEASGVPIVYAAMFVEADAGLTVEMTFDNPVVGWIGEFFGHNDVEDLEIEVHDASGIIDLIPVDADGFLGFTVATPVVTKLVFRGAAADLMSGGEVFGLDNICGHETPPGPEIDITGLGMPIPAGDTTPSAADGTDFGNEEVGMASAEAIFVIENNGALPLNLSSVVFAPSTDFAATTIPTTPIPAGGSSNLGVTFTPTATGLRTATITVNSDDSDEGAYSFVVQGTGTPPTDNVPPVITGAKDKVYTVSAGGTADASAHFAGISAVDDVDGPVPVSCSPDGTAPFAVGVTPASCSATDSAGNTATANFNIVVLEIQDTPFPFARSLDIVSLRGDAATGAGLPGSATINNILRAYLNNNGEIIYSASLSNAGTNNAAVFTGPLASPTAIAAKGTASGVGNFGNFSNLTLNDAGDAGFQSQLGSGPAHFFDTGGGPAAAAVKGGPAPTGGGELYGTLQKPALASNGELLTRANLQLGSGVGVTTADDTLITSSAGTVIVREGAPSGLLATNYDQLLNRIVASEDNGHIAFSSFLFETAGFDASDNTGLFTGILGGAPPALVLRENDAVPGIAGAAIQQFLGESINSSGEVAVRCTVRGSGINALNNEVLLSNSGGTLRLIAREGDVAPCLPNTLVAFDRFTTTYIGDDGAVCFHAFLKDATATPAVNSANDGSIWRWKDGQLHLIAREGAAGNNTDSALIKTIDSFACSGTGGIVYSVRFLPGIGDVTTVNNEGVYLDRGAADAVPELVLRRNDTFVFGPDTLTISGIKLSTEENPGGGTGGYGRAINDAGDILLNLVLSGNNSGIFVLGSP